MSSCPTLPLDIEELCSDRFVLPRMASISAKQEPKLRPEVGDLLRSVSEANVVALCTCQQSKDYPFCDNTHSVFNKATNSNLSPLFVAIVEGKCSNCGTKDNTGRVHHSQSCTITLSDRLHNSDDSPLNLCKCKRKPNKLTVSTPTLNKQPSSRPSSRSTTPTSKDIQTDTLFTPVITTPSSISTPTTPISTSNPIPVPSSTSTPTPTSTTPEPNTCNINSGKPKSTKVYTPSSIKSPINKHNIFTKAEVAEHATQDDLWMIINGNVYDVTEYVPHHPGGVRALVKFAGKDGTENVHYHSKKMLEILNQHYYVGKLPRHEGGPGGSSCIIS